jgi:hypothetical protein
MRTQTPHRSLRPTFGHCKTGQAFSSISSLKVETTFRTAFLQRGQFSNGGRSIGRFS